MAQGHQRLLKIEPSEEIQFEGPFTEVKTSHLVLTNTSRDEVAFKVKTTAPLMFCVKPNAGTIAGNSSITIDIMVQPLPAIPTLKKMFMVQSIAIARGVTKEHPWNPQYQGRMESSKLRAELIRSETEKALKDVLKMEPSSYITFTGPFTEVKTSRLVLKNLSKDPVACSLRSNSAQCVVVYPTSSVIGGGGILSVNVMVNPMNNLPYGVIGVFIDSISLADAVDKEDFFGEANKAKIVKNKLIVKLDDYEQPAPTSKFLLPKPLSLLTNSHITFTGGANETAISLTNPSDDLVAFKVLTTAPNRYAVQPNKGRLSKDESISITVKRVRLNVPQTETVNDKLLILSRAMHPDLEGKDLWSHRDKEMFSEAKISIIVEPNGANRDSAASDDSQVRKRQVH